MSSTPTELHTVLSLIDRSLEELKANPPTVSLTIDGASSPGGGARGGSSGMEYKSGRQPAPHHYEQQQRQQRLQLLQQPPLGPADASFVNDLTVDLLSEQKRSALLEEENARLRQRLSRFQQRVGIGGVGGVYEALGSAGGSSSAAASSKGTHIQLGVDLQNIVSTIHAQVDRQNDQMKQKQQDGMCVLAHGQIQGALDRCLTQLTSLRHSDRETQRHQTDLEDTAERCRDQLKAAEMEIQYMQEQRNTLQQQLEAFEAENMRLTNDIEELRFTSAQQQRRLDSAVAASQQRPVTGADDMQELRAARSADAERISELEKQIRRLQNELDEAMNVRAEQ